MKSFLGRIWMPLRFESSLGSSDITKSKSHRVPRHGSFPSSILSQGKQERKSTQKMWSTNSGKDRWGWLAIAVGKLLNHQEKITSSSKAQCFAKRGKNCQMCKACRNIHIVSPHCPWQVLKLPRVRRHSVLPFSILSEKKKNKGGILPRFWDKLKKGWRSKRIAAPARLTETSQWWASSLHSPWQVLKLPRLRRHQVRRHSVSIFSTLSRRREEFHQKISTTNSRRTIGEDGKVITAAPARLAETCRWWASPHSP